MMRGENIMENVIKLSGSKKPIELSGDSAKNYLIFHEVIRNYLPDLAKAVDSGDVDCNDLDIPRLFEKCVAMESGLTWANEQGELRLNYDLVEDQSDIKTSSVSRKKDKRTGYESIKGVISNTGGKKGDLRCVVYHDFTKTLDYFLVPQKHIRAYETHNGKGKYVIKLQYSILNEDYNQAEVFRVDTFKDICK